MRSIVFPGSFAATAPPAAATARAAITIVIADAHALFREALRRLLDEQPDLHVVGEASDANDAVRLAQTLRPSVLLLDLEMRGMAGLGPLAEIACIQPAVHTLILTARASDDEIIDAIQLGARGIVLKQTPTELLFKSVRVVSAGQFWIGRDSVGDLIEHIRGRAAGDERRGGPAFGLTMRELELVAAVVEGCANSDIAAQLKISSKTVKHHLTKIFGKLGVSTRLELAMFAVQHHLHSNRASSAAVSPRA